MRRDVGGSVWREFWFLVAEHLVDVAYLPALKPETQKDFEVFCSTSSFVADALGLAARYLCSISIRRIPDSVLRMYCGTSPGPTNASQKCVPWRSK
jgi:hypothetical protein